MAPAEPPVDPLSQPGFKRMLDRLAEWGLAQADASQRQALVQALRQQDWDSAQRLVQAFQPPSLAEQAESWSDQLRAWWAASTGVAGNGPGPASGKAQRLLRQPGRSQPALAAVKQLVTSWDDDRADEPVVEAGAELPPGETSPSPAAVSTTVPTVPTSVQNCRRPSGLSPSCGHWPPCRRLPGDIHPVAWIKIQGLSQWPEGQLEQAATPWRERGAQMLAASSRDFRPVLIWPRLRASWGSCTTRLHTVPMEPGCSLEAGGAM